MEIVEIKCPNCQGNIHITAGRKETYCEFCGSHLFLDDGNRVITNINVSRDETKLKKLEIINERIKKMEEQQKYKKIDWIAIESTVISFLLIFILTSLFGKGDNTSPVVQAIVAVLAFICVFSLGVCVFRYFYRHRHDVNYRIRQ